MAEPTYRFRRNADGATVSLTPSQFYSAGKARDRTGAVMYEALGKVPGFSRDGAGLLSATMIDPGDFHSIASQQYNSGYHTAFAMGSSKVDPRWEQSRKDGVESGKRKAAREYYSGAELVANRALSVMTAGASNAILTRSLGEEAGDALARARQESPGDDFVGSMLGLAGLAMMPLPGAGKLAGKLVGGSEAAALANVRNLFGISAAAGKGARNLVADSGMFVKGLFTTVASGAAIELPMSLAMASANLVDNNKQWSAEQMLVDAGTMAAWGMGLATVTGVPVLALRAGVGATARGVKGAAKTLQRRRDLSRMAEAGVGAVGYRLTRNLRSKGTGGLIGGSLIESGIRSQARNVGGRYRKSLTSTAKWITGEVSDDFGVFEKTLRQSLKNYDTGVSTTAKSLGRSAKELVYEIDDPVVAATIREVIDDPQGVLTASRNMGHVPVEAARIQTIVDNIGTRMPDDIAFTSTASSDLAVGLSDVASEAADSVSRRFSRELIDAASGLSKKPREAMKKTLEFRGRLEKEAGIAAPRLRRILDQRIDAAVGGSGELVELLAGLDRIKWSTAKLRGLADDIGATSKVKSKASVEKYAERLKQVELEMDRLPDEMLPKGGRDAYRKPNELWADQEMRANAQRVAQINELRSNLLLKDTWHNPNVEHPILKLHPKDKALSREALLETQIDYALRTKMGIQDAFKFLRSHGAPTRQTAAFTGVFHYRQMADHDERLAAFEEHRAALLVGASGPEAAIQSVGRAVHRVAQVDQEAAAGYSIAAIRSAQYLVKHMPSNEDQMPPSAAEVESWLERVGALENPVSLLYAANDASVMPEAVDALRTALPATYIEMILDVSEFVQESGPELTMTQLTGLDLFTGGALGIADGRTPMQPPMAQTPLQSQAIGSFGPQRMQQLQATMQTPNQKLGGL